ncbi:hypothetical protein IK112_03805 [Candidatus Saccharibacteria bacterium]|nr:hypothetical protein [Candidatus Saccharibacteria bacterium]
MAPVKKYKYTIPKDIYRQPEEHEKHTALILAQHFQTNVAFIKTSILKTADIDINGRIWEIKSPTGHGKRTIQHQFERAGKQAKRFVIDCHRTSMSNSEVSQKCKYFFYKARSAKALIIISKQNKIILELYK